jgi:hypothetical protein
LDEVSRLGTAGESTTIRWLLPRGVTDGVRSLAAAL